MAGSCRGAGKTTVGRAVAARLGRPFIDLDDVVAAEAGLSIAAIFALEGEAGFRRREAAAVAALVDSLADIDGSRGDDGSRGEDGDAGPAATRAVVVALGGGTLVDDANREALCAAGLVIVLDAPLGVLASRLGRPGAERPLLDSPRRGGEAGSPSAPPSVWPRLPGCGAGGARWAAPCRGTCGRRARTSRRRPRRSSRWPKRWRPTARAVGAGGVGRRGGRRLSGSSGRGCSGRSGPS
ncbi:MAG: shikimate kinase [Anaerolineae bacterium]